MLARAFLRAPWLAAALTTFARTAFAQASEPPVAAVAPAPAPPLTPAEKRASYSLPWSLRPALAPNLVRIDTAIVPQDAAFTLVPVLTAGYKPIESVPDLGFYARVGVVHHRPEGQENGVVFSNPVAFALYTPEVAPHVRLGLFAGVALPFGGGGGGAPDAASRRTATSGIYARQAMDNAMFAVNYLTPTVGAAVAWIHEGITLQAETTLLQLIRARGEAVDVDDARTNFTAGLHAGYRILKVLTASLEAHHQRFLTTPASVAANSAARDQTTVGGGFRLNLPLSDKVITRPGLAYFHPVDDPMATAGHRVIVFDLPVAF